MTSPCVGGCGSSLTEPGMCLACLEGARILHANALRRRDERLEQIKQLITSWRTGSNKVHVMDERTKTPADRLADAVSSALASHSISREAWSRGYLQEALEAYRSTRNGIGQTTAQTFGTPPDPILVARHLLDVLAGGALSSLICLIRDMSGPMRWPAIFAPDALDSIRANLRALGEKLP